MPDWARLHDRRRRAAPSISGQLRTATASAAVSATTASMSSKLPHTGTPTSVSSVGLASVWDTGAHDPHAVMRVSSHLLDELRRQSAHGRQGRRRS